MLGRDTIVALACEQGLISCARTLKTEGRSVFRASHYVAWNLHYVDVRTLPCRQRVDDRGSQIDGRRSMVDGCGSRVAVLLLGRHAIVAQNV